LRLLNMTGNKIDSLIVPNSNILENKRGLNGLLVSLDKMVYSYKIHIEY